LGGSEVLEIGLISREVEGLGIIAQLQLGFLLFGFDVGVRRVSLGVGVGIGRLRHFVSS